jgi:hypothetical protein
MAAKSLTELANLYGSDKGTVGPSARWSGHNYTDIYEAYMERDRYSAITLLEIGLGVVGDRWNARIVHGRNTGGASLRMWYDYFPNGSIFGIDVNRCSYLDNDRIKTFVADQSSVHELGAFTEATKGIEFDIIIDDGSHRPDHQQVSLSFFFKRLKSGGLYFIEDLANNGLGDGARGRHACDKVKNTRSVLKHFRDYGKFLEPNALMDSAYLAQNIASLNFHAPEYSLELALRPSLRHPLKRTIDYKADRESLCVIRKR